MKHTAFLSRAARAGDRGSFGELFERVMPALYVWTDLRNPPGPLGRTETQDILQEVWLRALQSFEGYDPGLSFRGWIIGIAKNVLLQCYARRSELPLGAPAPASTCTNDRDVPDSITSIGQRLARDESIGHFLSYVAELDPEDQSLLVYCGIEEYTCAQAAARIGISPDAASKRWQALRARIKRNGVLEALAFDIGE